MKILAIVPARSGSKGIRNKNMTNFLGKPLIFHTLNILKKLNNIVYPFVSTDSKRIIKYSKKIGFDQSYLRPKRLSSDKSNVVDAVLHGLNWFKKKNIKFDYVLLLEPTSPNRNIDKLKKIIKKALHLKLDSSASASKLPFHPSESIYFKNKSWKFIKKNKKTIFRRQEFDKNYYFIDGNFYLCKTSFIEKYKQFIIENKTFIFVNNSSYPIDINNNLDLKIAEVVMSNEKK